MNTLPANRTLNTFNGGDNRRSSISAIRYARSTSLYFPNTDTDEESRSHLLTKETLPENRRGETLGRPNRINPGSRNLTNPLFDSMGSLDQPWSRGYGQAVVLSPPKIGFANQLLENEIPSVFHDIQPSLRTPTLPRTPVLHGGYSTIQSTPRTNNHNNNNNNNMKTSSHHGDKKKIKSGPCGMCFGNNRFESSANLYSSADEMNLVADRFENSHPHHHQNNNNNNNNNNQQSYLTCLSLLFGLVDLFLLFGLGSIVFFLNCSANGWFYADQQIQLVCKNLWSNWIPLYQRKFRCPALPPGYNENNIDTTNEVLKPLLDRLNLGKLVPGTLSNYPITTPIPNHELRQNSIKNYDSNTNRGSLKNWDADLGLMIPPKLINSLNKPNDQPVLYGPQSDLNYLVNKNSKYSWSISDPSQHFSTNSIISCCIIIPIIIICCAELLMYFLNCCQFCLDRNRAKQQKLRQFYGRLYRILISYIYGLLTTIFIVFLIKIIFGRLRPDFIQICKPNSDVCPKWYSLLQKSNNLQSDPNSIENDPRLLELIVTQLAKQGRYLVTVAATQSPEIKNDNLLRDELLTNTDCTENNILVLKDARMSFPSLSVSISTYAIIFITVYIFKLMRNFRTICLCIPFLLLIVLSLITLVIGINRVIYRQNWLEDVIVGWIIGSISAIFSTLRILAHLNKDKDLSNRDLNYRLMQIYGLIQTNQEYKQSEKKKNINRSILQFV